MKESKTNNQSKEKRLVTKESFCATCGVFSFLILLILFSRSLIFDRIGLYVHNFFMGAFGYLAYPFMLGVFYFFVTTLFDKRLVKNRRLFASVTFMLIFLALILHTAFTWDWELKGYVQKCFAQGENFPKTTIAGAVGGCLIYLLSLITTKIGASIFFSLFAIACGYFAFLAIKTFNKVETGKGNVGDSVFEIPLSQQTTPQQVAIPKPEEISIPQKEEKIFATPFVRQTPGVQILDEDANKTGNAFSPFGGSANTQSDSNSYDITDGRAFLFGSTPAENYKRNLIFDPNSSVNKRPSFDPTTSADKSIYPTSYSEAYQESVNREEYYRPAMVVNDQTQQSTPFAEERKEEPYVSPVSIVEEKFTPSISEQPILERESYTLSEPIAEEIPSFERRGEPEKIETEYKRHDYMDLFSPSNPNVFGRSEEPITRNVEDSPSFEEERGRNRRGIDIFDEEEEEGDFYTLRSERSESPIEEESRRSRVSFTSHEPIKKEVKPVEQPTPPPPPKPRVIRPYVRPHLDDFDCRDIEPTANPEEVEQTKADIIATLEDFKVSGATIASVTFGPTVTRYNVALPRSVSPQKVVALDQPLAIGLRSSGVNVYPNYEDGVVSIEVPNKQRQFVQLGCMLSGDTFVNAKPSSIMFAMGKDVANRKVYGDVTEMVHMLVAGATKAGKSVFLGSLIISLIYKYSPEELRLILIDPKKTEFVLYNNLPHLMINEIITDVNKTVQSLNWAIGEMNRRYGLFEQMSLSGRYVVNLDQYNAQLEKQERLPKIVIIIDELADLMLAAKKEIESKVQNLTQKARAAGIHLIVATQRPSTDVITGIIKSNLPTRIAFGVPTDVDSRVILDQSGAQKLLGKGDFLYTMPGVNSPVRVQSAFISPEDSQKVVNFIKANNEAYYDEEATAYINNTRSVAGDDSSADGDESVDPIYIEALKFAILSGSASISMIQRKCSAGFNRAGKIIEWMENMGYISPFDGAKPRKVLITKEEFENLYGSIE